jgi:hypothetical protein
MAKEKDVLFISPAFTLGYHEALFTAQQGKNEAGEPSGPPKYGIKAIWDPAGFGERDKALWEKLLGELDRVSREAFKKPWDKLPANIKRGLRDGAEDLEYVGEGKFFASLTSIYPIGVINLAGDEIGPEHGNTSQIYSGAICRAQVTVYPFNVLKAKGISIGIRNLQKLKDGKRTGGGVSAKEAFGQDEIDEDYLANIGDQNEESAF